MTTPVVCFDVDGTLVNAEGWIHPRDRQLLAGTGEVLLVPATGRPLHAIRRAFVRNGLFVDGPIPLPLVLQNGAVLYKPGEQLLKAQPVTQSVRQVLVEIAGRFPQVATLLFSHDCVHVWHPDSFSERLINRFDLDARLYTAADAGIAFTKFIFMSEDEGALAEIGHVVSGLPVESSRSLATVMEVNDRGVEKEGSLSALLEAMGVEAGPFLAAGDGENDLSLLRAADLSFSPASALPAVRASSSYVLDVDREGVLAPMLAHLS